MNSETKKLDRSIKISVLGAIAFILMFIEVPVIPLFPWLKMDLSEVPVLMGAFAFGPLSGIVIEILKLVLHLLIKGTSTGGIGELANFLVGAAFILPASIIYNKHRSKKTAIIGMIVGALVMEAVGIISNVYLLLPAYGMQMDSTYLMKYVTIGLLPFNGIKAVVVSIITFILYRRVSTSVFKVQSNFGDNKKIENRV
ncbi:Riboflavin transporter FmnP [Clostridium sp. DSM 8431]|uniref:ECF transporter S component n=1 Tax=Clostridium sp. DSM 8431 TaxID=1761781 RepID=UPI0008E1E42A|nr:ECF transporter S component [Clostridium sp. DSM 8431]SFU79765.1 Riboflavin transporter FmnP [Clostridium sp. DSM 8431]